ncbi:hypothetical protein HYW55_02335 [Candidatus Gottesmanbacteria bacterium]|nr:hypothetical protein [Candidatus Gottesmanbacteria bacterium]
MNILSSGISSLYNSIVFVLSTFAVKFFAGILVLLIGLIVSSLLKDLLLLIFRYFRVGKWLTAAGLTQEEKVNVWPKLLAELLRWTVIFIFLISAVDIWGIPRVGEVLSQLLQFLPSVFVAVVIGWIGLVAARFAYDIVRHGVGGVAGKESLLLATLARYAIIFFTTLIVLTQLGVAADLIKILFTGIVAMLSISFGLAFGLGGIDEAKGILSLIRGKIEEKESLKKNDKRRKK